MCWQDGFGMGKAKNSWETTHLAATFPPDQNHTITRQDGEPSRTDQIELISVVFEFQKAFICLISSWVACCCSIGQKSNVFLIRAASHLLYVPPPLPLIGPSSKIMRVFFSVLCYDVLPRRWPRYTAADGCRAWCGRRTRCWSPTASFSQMVGYHFCRINHFFFVRDWCTGQLNSPGDRKLQASALGFTMEKSAYLNSCYSCFSAQYWLLLWDKRRAVAYRKRTLQNPKTSQRAELKTCGMISGDIGKCSFTREKKKSKTPPPPPFYGLKLQKRWVTRDSACMLFCVFKGELPLGCRADASDEL